MDLELISQHARTIKETYNKYVALVKQKQDQLQNGMLDQKIRK